MFLAALGGCAGAQDTSDLPTFGTTVVVPGGFCGEIYHLHNDELKLPRFEKLEPVGVIYTSALNVPPRYFDEGFPGVSKRFEWFAIDYRGRFWIEKPGKYEFYLASDDGSKLYIDDKLIINLDRTHPPEASRKRVNLSGGIHKIRVSYFQGPRYYVALVLGIAGPGERLRVFNTDEFKPPPNPEDWTFGEAREGLQVAPGQDPNRRKLVLKDPSVTEKRTTRRCPDER